MLKSYWTSQHRTRNVKTHIYKPTQKTKKNIYIIVRATRIPYKYSKIAERRSIKFLKNPLNNIFCVGWCPLEKDGGHTEKKRVFEYMFILAMPSWKKIINNIWDNMILFGDRRCRGRMIVGFTATYVISAYHH
jgi:hypothetical protein